MGGPSITVSDALGEAMDFARDAWRESWAVMGLVAAGWALIVVGDHAQLRGDDAALLRNVGFVLLLAHLPLLGALYRLGVAGRSLQTLGPGGLQLGRAEWRIVAVNAVIGFFFFLACIPLALISGALFVGFRRLGGVTLGPLGHWSLWFLAAAAVCVAGFAVLAYLAGRLSLATPLSIEREHVTPWAGWPLTEGHGRTIAIAFVLAHVPTLLIWVGLQTFGWIEPADTPVGLHGAWPLPEAIGAGVVAGLALSAIQAPLSVGLLTFFYDVLAPIDEREVSRLDETSAPSPRSDEDLGAEHEPEPELEDEPEPDPPYSTVDYSPHTGRFSRIAAPWMADEPVPAVYRSLAIAETEPDADPAPEPERGYPHSIVEYSPHSGRFSRLFAPWLADEAAPEFPAASNAEPDVQPGSEPAQTIVHPPLDAADEPGHAAS